MRSHFQDARALRAAAIFGIVGGLGLALAPSSAYATDPPPPTCAELTASWDSSATVLISSADELYCIGENATTLDLDYRLSSDIDLSLLEVDTAWRPIGLGSAFTGSLDGSSDGDIKAITNLVINAAGAAGAADGEQYIGLFSKISDASITNLTLTSPVVHAGSFSGALVGEATRSTLTNITATNVTVTGDLTGEIKVGGVVGYAVNSTMTSISASGTVEADDQGWEVGGIIGRIDAGPSDGATAPGMTVTDVDFSGTVRANTSAGGILGAADAPDTNGTKWISISNASSAGTVSTINAFDPTNWTTWNNSIGGLVGIIYDSDLSDLHSTANVDVEATEVGGLIGWAGNIRLTNASATGDVTAVVTGEDMWCDTGGLIGWLERAFVDTDQEIVPISNVEASGNVSCNGGRAIGGLFGYVNGTDLTEGRATGDVTGVGRAPVDETDAGSAAHSVGGLAGYVYDTTLTDVSASGDVSTDGDFVGGLVGYGYRSNPAEVSVARDVVITRGQASGSVRGRSHVGGIVGDGEVWNGDGNLQVLSSIATGTVKGLQMVGGIAGGDAGDFLLRDTVSTGAITGWVNTDGTPPSADLGYYGGLVGYLSATGSIERSYTTSTITTDIETYAGDGDAIPAYNPDAPTVGSMIGVSEGAMTGLSFTATNPSTLRIAGQLPAADEAKAVYRSLSQLGELATYESWNTPDTVIVAGWVPSPRTTQIWGTCTDVASGLPFLQWQRTSACATAPSPTPDPAPTPSNGGGSGSGASPSTTGLASAPATPVSASNAIVTPVVSTGSQPVYRQPALAQPVTGTVTLVPAKVAASAPIRAVRQEPSPSIGAAPVITATVNQPVKLLVPGLTPGASYVVQIKSSKGYVVLGSVTANANGQLQLPVFRTTKPTETTIAIVSSTGKASYVKVSASKAGGKKPARATTARR